MVREVAAACCLTQDRHLWLYPNLQFVERRPPSGKMYLLGARKDCNAAINGTMKPNGNRDSYKCNDDIKSVQ